MRKKNDAKIKIFIVTVILTASFLSGAYCGGKVYSHQRKESGAVSSNNVYAEKVGNTSNKDKVIYEKVKNKEDNKINNANLNSNDKSGCYIQTKILSSKTDEKVAYLSFDDGPTYTTPKILDILHKYDIKATFFVVGSMCKNNPEILKREFREGEYICNHTYSHDYKYIYSNPQNFLADVEKCEKIVDSILGQNYKTTLVRFPGGSSDKGQVFKDNLTKAGYNYVDWNALSGDAEKKGIPVSTLIQNVKNGVTGHKKVIILMHDCTQENTVEALPAIIEYLKSHGYIFRTLKEV